MSAQDIRIRITIRNVWVALAALLLATPPDRSAAIIEELIASGKHQQALDLLARSPGSVQHRLLSSQAYEGLGDAASAVREAEAALALDARSEAAHLRLGQIFLAHNTPEAALDIFSEALTLLPESVLLRLGRGLALKDLTRYEEAEKDLLGCLASKPGLSLAFDALATVYLHTKRFDDARVLADQFRATRPADYRGYYFAAAAREGLTHPRAAIEPLLVESIRLNPEYAASHGLLGKLRLLDGRTQEAITSLEQALRLRPDFTPAALHLAQAYRKAGRPADASAAFLKVRELKEKEQAPRPSLKYHRGRN